MIKHYIVYEQSDSYEKLQDVATILNELFNTLPENQKSLVVPKYVSDKSMLVINEGEAAPALCVIRVVDGQYVSAVAGWSDDEGGLELGILTNPDFQGQGYGKDVMQRFLNILGRPEFDDISILYYEPWHKNEASIHIAESLGFEYEESNEGWLTYIYKIR